jgi:TfoX/Sxy family transcriptional regulator of competence genes
MSPSQRAPMPKMPKPDDAAKEFFRSVVPDAPNVAVRPMFGNLSAFVNGNMFMGLFGNDVFVRVADAERQEITEAGGRPFEPMPGRPMTGYVVLPAGWRDDPDAVRTWADRSMTWAEQLPPKQPKKRR